MQVIKNIAELCKLNFSPEQRPLGFVPTMGCLHEGHLSLVRQSREQCQTTVVSIYVNPTQFGAHEDFDNYPRTFARDCELLRQEGVDLVFAPTTQQIYPDGFSTYVIEEKLSTSLCGGFRPAHFRGVTTIVAKLFNLVKPDIAFFGEKDLQQFKVLEKMVLDLNMDITMRACPTVREKDGLAMSSRNNYLTPEQREVAPKLFYTLKQMQQRYHQGEHDAVALVQWGKSQLEETGDLRVQYLEVCSLRDLQPVTQLSNTAGKTFIAAAVYLGETRLIDNLKL